MSAFMNLWSALGLGLLGAVYLAGFIALVYCAKHAPEGYEDVDGFHVGPKPGMKLTARDAPAASVSDALKQATWRTAAPF
jgi:hypothetical protein